jgi:hypothetical protein
MHNRPDLLKDADLSASDRAFLHLTAQKSSKA